MVAQIIGNEAFHYTAPRHGPLFTERLWYLGKAVHQSLLLELKYTKMNDESMPKRIVGSVAILFSEYYFYLTGPLSSEGLPIFIILHLALFFNTFP